MFQLVKRNTEEDKTMHWKITALWGGKKVELRETQRAVTPFGGLVVFFEFLRRIGYCEAVQQHLPFTLRSPNAIDPVKTFTAFLLSVVAGARRFAHTSLLRADSALQALLGISRFPIDDTVRNLFKRFGQGQCQRFFSGLWSWQFERLPECASGYSLDLDSTVFERYGHQQAWPAFASSAGGGAGGSALSAARLAAQRQLRHRARGGGVFEGSLGVVAGKTHGSRGAGRRRLF